MILSVRDTWLLEPTANVDLTPLKEMHFQTSSICSNLSYYSHVFWLALLTLQTVHQDWDVCING